MVVGSRDHTPAITEHSITVRYATETVAEFDPPDTSVRTAPSGEKFILVRAAVTVESQRDENIDMDVSIIGLESEGGFYESHSLPNLPEFTRTVAPGTTYDAWLQYEVPEDITGASLIATDPRDWFGYGVEIFFEQDSSLSATVPENSQ